jgi:hypothetical protein
MERARAPPPPPDRGGELDGLRLGGKQGQHYEGDREDRYALHENSGNG